MFSEDYLNDIGNNFYSNNNSYCPIMSFHSSDDDNNPFYNDNASFNFLNEGNNTPFTYEEENREISSPNPEDAYMVRSLPINSVNMNVVDSSQEKKLPKDKNKTITKTTAEKTKIQQITKKKVITKGKIFLIEKENKKRGRNRKNCLRKNSKRHTKYKYDNIITKIKRALYNHSLKYINKKLRNSHNPALRKLKLLKIKSAVILVHKKEKNEALLKKTLKEIFSNDISCKYSKLINDNIAHNRKTIKTILDINDKEMNAILNTTLKEILDIYTLKNKKNEYFSDFTNINDDMETFNEENNSDDDYIKKYKYYAENLEKEIKKIHPRRERMRKI